MRIVIAPDKFKGTLRADEVARAMEIGARRALPRCDVVEVPVADGGEGTQEVLLRALGGNTEHLVVPGPLGEPVEATLACLTDGTAVVESAQASGLVLVPGERRDPLRASTSGTGLLVRAALERSPSSVLVAVGGTASTDGGVGAASACGWSFTDERGAPIAPNGGGLTALARIRVPAARRPDVRIVGACDVDVPLVGDRGAASLFAPQKGAGPHEVALLERGLVNLARRVREDVGVDLSSIAHAGAGGGLGAGLAAFFGASLRPGFDVVAEAVGLRNAIEGSDLVLTGEGRLDAQTPEGKSVGGVVHLARSAGVPCAAIAGVVDLPESSLRRTGIVAASDLVALYGEDRALGDPSGCISEATYAMVASMLG